MSEQRMTPRIGDRVLVVRGFDSRVPHSRCGWLRGYTAHGGALVDLDPVDDDAATERLMVPYPHLEVLDRQPVEWPDGFEPSPMGPRYVALRLAAGSVFSPTRAELEQLGATIPDMLANFDELVERGI